MDLGALSALSLPDQDGTEHELGDQRYSHIDADSTDHAAIPDVLAAAGV